MNLSQILPIDVSVDLGRRDVDVTKHLLDRAEIDELIVRYVDTEGTNCIGCGRSHQL